MASFHRMSEGRRRRIEGSVIGRDDDIVVDFVAFVQFESADDDDLVGFPSDDDIDGAVGCLGADGDSSAGRTTTLMGGCTWGELSNGHGARPPRQSGRAVGRVRGIPGEDPRGERRRRKAGAVAQQSRRRRRLLNRQNFHPPLGPGQVVSDTEVWRGVTPRFPALPRTRCCDGWTPAPG